MIILVLALSANTWAKDKVNLNVDDVQYYRKKNLIVAKGNAHLKTKKIELWADELRVNMNDNTLTAFDNVEVKGENRRVESEKLDYNFKDSAGIFVNAESIVVDNSIKGKLYLSTPKIDYGQDESKLD